MVHQDLRTLMADLEYSVGLVKELAILLEQHPAGPPPPRVDEIVRALSGGTQLMQLPRLLLRAHAEIGEAMGSLRISREMLEAQAIDRLRATHGKLSEVNSTAETAAMAIMNGVDEALGLVEQVNPGDEAGRGAQDRLRTTLMDLYNHLQFQDITSQQIQGVAGQLNSVEQRLTQVARMFEPGSDGDGDGDTDQAQPAAADAHADSTSLAYNPDAVFQHGGARQADVDAAIAAAKTV